MESGFVRHGFGALGVALLPAVFGFQTPRLRPIDLMPALLAWWEPDLGGVTLATITPTVYASYSQGGLTGWPGSVPHLVEDLSTGPHYLAASGPGTTNGPYRATYRLSSTNRGVWAGNGLAFGKFDLQTGTYTFDPGVIASIMAAGAEWDCTVELMSAAAHYLDLTKAGSNSYTGDGASRVTVGTAAPTLRQDRCPALADQGPHGYDLAEGAPGNQPYVDLQDGSSPGGTVFPGHACIKQPNDSNRRMTTSAALFLAALENPFSVLIRLKRLGTPAANAQLVDIAGSTRSITIGSSTTNFPYVLATALLTSPVALDTSERTLGVVIDPGTGSTTILIDGVVVAGPTLLGSGAIGVTLFTHVLKRFGVRALGVSGTAMTPAQMLAVHNAFS